MQVNGKFLQNLPTQEGDSQRGHWMRGGFVIEAGDDYPRKLAFTSFGEDRVNQHKNIPAGMPVQVRFVPESREYNEKWYTELRTIVVTPLAQGTTPAIGAIQYPATFQAQPSAPVAMPQKEDDLPF